MKGGDTGMVFWQGRCRRDAAEGVCTHVFHVAEGVVDSDDLSALLHARGTAHEAADAPKSRDAHLHLMRKHGRHAIKGKLGAWLVRGGPGFVSHRRRTMVASGFLFARSTTKVAEAEMGRAW